MFAFETPEEAIIRLHNKGFSIRKIRAALRVGTDRISNTIKYYHEYSEIPKPKIKGRPSKKTEEILAMITMLTINDRSISSYSIAHKIIDEGLLNISPSTVLRYRKSLEFQYKPPKIRQFLSPIHIFNRILFAHSMLVSNIDFEKIIFSDESRFCRCNDGQFRWYRKGELDDQVFADKSKFDFGIMVFGIIGFNYKSKLVIIEGSVNDISYREILQKSEMCKDLDSRYGQGQYIFMQDGAPAHTSFLSTLHLQKICSYLKFWPANSPDINPIENLWGAMKRILKTFKIDSKSDLIEKVLSIWELFPQDSINRLVLSFSGRLRTVISENGGSISEILRKGIHYAPEIVLPYRDDLLKFEDLVALNDPCIDDNPIEFKTRRQYSIEEDLLLLQKVRDLGNKWTLISKYFEDRTPTSLRNRYNKIRK